MINNCAGGKTPWGTWLTAEENFQAYFGGSAPEAGPLAEAYRRYGIPGKEYAWAASVDRFDVAKEPNEPHRFGWMVEIDPYDPASVPIKRTALGRMKHEGATTIINKDGRLVAYMGDDERFDYLYKYVSNGTYDPAAGTANGALLDDGVLYVARFEDDRVIWLPLAHGEGPLTAQNGFASQAEVLIFTRLAADLLGATPMDRPEDVEPNPLNGRVYVALTNNTRRKAEQVDGPNPRPENAHGQIVELVPPGDGADPDHAALEFGWNMLILAGDPAEAGSGASYGKGSEAWFSSPDNVVIDPQGRLWISTDQGGAQAGNGIPDGIFCCELEGPARAAVKFFFAAPRGAEMCGPEFTPDGRTLFVAPQHPAEMDGFVSTFENPATRWPDFAEGMPPRPSIVAITKDDGGPIGG
jgi:secreted PhoX family phosphatase